MNDAEKTCKLFLNTAIEAGKLQNKIMNDMNAIGRARITLKESSQRVFNKMDETIGLLGDAAMNMKILFRLAIGSYNNGACDLVVDKTFQSNKINKIDNVKEKGDAIIKKMEKMASKMADRFK